MAYKYGTRKQITFLPDSIEKYVSEDDPVRVYDAFIDAINLNELGLEINSSNVGNSSYDPVAMLKVLVYGYSYGWRSSRKLERALYHNLSFIWLAGGLKPDHKTIANFRRNNKSALKNVLKQCVQMCIKFDLVEGNVLFIDGSKIRANAGNSQTLSKASLNKILVKVDGRIEELLNECNKIDEQETGRLIKIKDELKNKEKLKSKINELVNQINSDKSINLTDPDCRIMKGRQGSHAAYNGQIVVDDTNGLIVSAQTVGDVIDRDQLNDQVEQAESNMNKTCKVACADAGYSSVDALKTLVESDRTVIVPNGKQAQKIPPLETPFDKDKFRYNPENNTYTCPEGKELYCSYQAKGSNKIAYRMKNYHDCLKCRQYGTCTSAKKGRTVSRLVNEHIQDQLINTYKSKFGQEIYRRRKSKVELPFGHIKRNMGVQSFLLRGCEGVNAEFSLISSCFNITRLIKLMGGVRQLVNQLQTI